MAQLAEEKIEKRSGSFRTTRDIGKDVVFAQEPSPCRAYSTSTSVNICGTARAQTGYQTWRTATVTAMSLMILYFVIINHVDLYPWNNLLVSQLTSTLTGVIPFSIYLIAFLKEIHWLMLIGVVHSYVWLGLQVRQWWIPYLFGPTPIHHDFSWYTDHGYGETLKFLPAAGDRPVPDAEHIVQQLLSLAVVITSTIAYMKMRGPSHSRVRRLGHHSKQPEKDG